jgi:Fic family protein
MPGHRLARIWQHDPTLDAPAKYRRACAYEAFVPDRLTDLAVTLDVDVAAVVSEAERAIHDLNAAARPALAPLARLLLRTESIASSKVEGMQLGLRELARAEARQETGGSAGPTAVQILANIDAMQLAVDEAATADRFGVPQIVAIHTRLMAGAPNPRRAGQLRTTQNWIGGNDYNPCGADFVPPPPEEVDALLADLCDSVNDDRLAPLVQAALVHAQFETIHPFDDGNGRTGRALVHVVLRRRGLATDYVPPVSVILANARDRYIAALGRFRADGVTDWIEHFAGATLRAARLASAYLREVDALKARWRACLTETVAPRADAAAWALIDALPAYPIVTAPIAAAATGRSKAPVYQAIEQLQTAGVLVALGTSRRNQAWEAIGLFDLLSALEDGRLPDR